MHFPTLFCLVASSVALQFPGDRIVIPAWHLQSTRAIDSDLTAWSLPHADVSSWYRVGSKATVLAGLIESGVYNVSDLFYSDHLSALRESDYQVPWLYREEFSLPALAADQHLSLTVHGVSSKADIFFNGVQIASSDFQRGSYAGHSYDITPYVLVGTNALLIKAYPTDYLRELAVSWVDWNPRPTDNGTGVWREVDLKLTGPVSLSLPRVITNFTSEDYPSPLVVAVTVKTDVTSSADGPVDAMVCGTVLSPDKSQRIELSRRIRLPPRSSSTVSLNTTLSDPQIWWPAAWGAQPLYQTPRLPSMVTLFKCLEQATHRISFSVLISNV